MSQDHSDPLLRQARTLWRRAKSLRERAARSTHPKELLSMARGNERHASKWFKRWRHANPQAPHPGDWIHQ